VLALAGAVVLAMVVAGIVLVAGGSIRSGVAFEAFGVAAAVLALGLVLRIATRTRVAR
jgi:hypothetical protein